jgi:hypothetical protein
MSWRRPRRRGWGGKSLIVHTKCPYLEARISLFETLFVIFSYDTWQVAGEIF